MAATNCDELSAVCGQAVHCSHTPLVSHALKLYAACTDIHGQATTNTRDLHSSTATTTSDSVNDHMKNILQLVFDHGKIHQQKNLESVTASCAEGCTLIVATV
jgi:hypothetical protein